MYAKVDALVAASKITAEQAKTFKEHNSQNADLGGFCECAVCEEVSSLL